MSHAQLRWRTPIKITLCSKHLWLHLDFIKIKRALALAQLQE
jgi:hypothetical protein